MAEYDVREGQSATIDAIRYADNRKIIKVNGSFKICNNTDEVQLSVPAEDVDELVAALRAAEKLLG